MAVVVPTRKPLRTAILLLVVCPVQLLRGQPHILHQPEGREKRSRVEPFDETLNKPDEMNQIYDCALRTRGIYEKCELSPLSCKNGRCGSVINSLPVPDSPEEYHGCSCDVACQLYHDCCWDFHTICPAERRQYQKLINKFRRFNSAKIECDEGVAVVTVDVHSDSFDGKYPYQKNDWPVKDYRQPIVFARGIQFRNLSVYNYFFEKGENYSESEKNSAVIWWRKSLKLRFAIPHHELEDFFLEGKASLNIRFGLQDIPPKGMSARLCPFDTVTIKCVGCWNPKPYIRLNFNGMTHVCRSLSRNYFQTQTGRRSATIEWMTSSPQISSATQKTISDFESGLITIPSNADTTTNSSNHEYLCETSFSHDARQRNFNHIFSVVLTIGPGPDNYQLGSFKSDGKNGWESLKFVESLADDSSSKSKKGLIKICYRGFLFNGEDCAQPSTLFVQISGQISHLPSLTHLMRSTRNKIMERFQGTDPYLDFEVDTREINTPYSVSFRDKLWQPTGSVHLDTEVPILSYNLTYDSDRERLPITDYVIDDAGFRHHPNMTGSTLSSLDNIQYFVVLCLKLHSTLPAVSPFDFNSPFAVVRNGSKEKFIICDGLFWYGNEMMVSRHFTVNAFETSVIEKGEQLFLSLSGKNDDRSVADVENKAIGNQNGASATVMFVLSILLVLIYY